MSRVRISTTVDGDRLERGRRLVDGTDSELLDEALDALIAAHERIALRAQPYDDDPDLAMPTFDGPDLPYDGEVPNEVLRLAEERRRARS
jgi:hypothetical protein